MQFYCNKCDLGVLYYTLYIYLQPTSFRRAISSHSRLKIPDLGQAINTQAVIHFLFIRLAYPPVLLCCRSYSQTRLPIQSPIRACLFYKGSWSHPHHLAHSGLLGADSWLWNCPIALQPVSPPCSQHRHLAVSLLALLLAALKSLTALQSVSSPCSRYRHLGVGLVTLQSVSSPCCQPPRFAAGRLEICLIALQSVSSPCSQYQSPCSY